MRLWSHQPPRGEPYLGAEEESWGLRYATCPLGSESSASKLWHEAMPDSREEQPWIHMDP